MHRLILAAALIAAAAGTGCLQNLAGAASPAAEAVREAVYGRVLETTARIQLYEAPLRLPGLWFLPAPAVPKQTALADRQRVRVECTQHEHRPRTVASRCDAVGLAGRGDSQIDTVVVAAHRHLGSPRRKAQL